MSGGQHPVEKQVIDRISAGIMAFDDEWRFTYVNDAAEEIFQEPAEELLGNRIWDLFPESRETEFFDKYHEALETREQLSIELYYDEWDKWYREELFPSPEGLTVISQDVTEQKRRERELEVLNERLTVALEGAHAGVWEWVPETGEVVWHETTERLFGLDPGEFEGTFDAVMEFIPEDSQEILEAEIEKVLPTHDPLQIEYRAQRADGEEWWMYVHSVFVDIEGLSPRYVGMAADITARKEQEMALAEKTERLDRFASVLAHDIRNPLSVAKGRVDLAMEDSQSAHLEEVQSSLERIEGLIESLLALSREGEQAESLEPIELKDIAFTAWSNVESPEADLHVTQSQTIDAHRSRLIQLFENLYRNAIEHGRSDVQITVGTLPDGFYIEDDGPGIPETKRDEVFAPGVSGSAEGTGYGLAIVSQIVESHDWRVTATASETGGARFEITGVRVVD